MTFDDRLLDTLVVKRHTATGALDDYGQPVVTVTTVATVPGLVQPRRAREIALANQEGAEIGQFVGYMRPLAGTDTDCWLEVGGVRYDVIGVVDAGGVGHHLELDLKRIG